MHEVFFHFLSSVTSCTRHHDYMKVKCIVYPQLTQAPLQIQQAIVLVYKLKELL